MNQETNKASTNVVWNHATVTQVRREEQSGHSGAIVWLTVLTGAEKSTLAHAVENDALLRRGRGQN